METALSTLLALSMMYSRRSWKGFSCRKGSNESSALSMEHPHGLSNTTKMGMSLSVRCVFTSTVSQPAQLTQGLETHFDKQSY